MKPGYIYAPYIMQTRTEPDIEYNKFMKQYHKDHDVCPKCGSQSIRTTLMGYILDMSNKEAYKDKNNIECMDCGFRGIYHELVKRKE